MPTVRYTLADTWRLNNRVNLMLLDPLTPEQLAHVPSPRARSIADQFAHLHNVRLMWLEVRSAEVLKSLGKIEKGATAKEVLHAALEASSEAFAQWFDTAERSGEMKAGKRGVNLFFAYAIAHEAHTRGQIIVHLKHAGMPIDRMLGFALWEWEKI